MSKEVVVLTLARGESDRMPGKNVRLLNGRPLVAYTIEAGIKSFGHCYVSTDDEHIARVSAWYHGSVIPRPSRLAQSDTPASEVLAHLFSTYFRGNDCDVIFINTTSPLRTSDDIVSAYDFFKSGFDSVLSVCRFNKFLWKDHKPINYSIEKRPRTQDVLPIWQENGAIYISTSEIIRKNKGNWLAGKIGLYEMPFSRSFEIDMLEDFQLCEWITRGINASNYQTDWDRERERRTLPARAPHTGELESGRFDTGSKITSGF